MSNLIFEGKIESVQEIQEGVSNSGNAWKKVGFLVGETEGQYPKKGGFTIFGTEKVDRFFQYNKVGDVVKVSFNVDTRQYTDKNGVERFGTDLMAWRVETVQGGSAVDAHEAAQAQQPPADDISEEEEDDLPF